MVLCVFCFLLTIYFPFVSVLQLESWGFFSSALLCTSYICTYIGPSASRTEMEKSNKSWPTLSELQFHGRRGGFPSRRVVGHCLTVTTGVLRGWVSFGGTCILVFFPSSCCPGVTAAFCIPRDRAEGAFSISPGTGAPVGIHFYSILSARIIS